MTARPSILFVCLGNICRSPMAEGAMRALAEREGVEVHLDSAGTGDWHVGNPPDPRAIAEARSNGVDIAHFRARQVTKEDFSLFTHVLALDAQNLRDLERLRPGDATARLALLLDAVPGREGQAVADPYHGGPEGFARTWSDVSAAAQALLERFR
ncbi:low molecular weight protein-tyrosine-phosphatase [Aurantiacibacter poecillastricola]|uniref:low molecular weight protein-tyrosine-phosphatase n=1 Tax=Aurantiacibacter poecillastricola TaxID=3064385 RepID=UPI00273FB995|nr:low molecular weight protein-tyrosine-phosphatase [Aurantiacibacter sp. 219JJ12-13]MDP5263159.1 low molecular weight protein-tyrosine-phosphatase [Aurantiacibacter sp. 219JJ12-13]